MWELEQINAVARISGNDTIFDALLLRLHTETACRGGALGIQLHNLDTDRCLIQLREKGNTVRWQPITPALTNGLADHAAARGTVLPTDALLWPCHPGHYDQPVTHPNDNPRIQGVRRGTLDQTEHAAANLGNINISWITGNFLGMRVLVPILTRKSRKFLPAINSPD